MRFWRTAVWAALLFCFSLPASAAPVYQPGFKTLGIWLEDQGLRLDINVWYPSVRKPLDVQYGPWELHVARNGREAEGRFPLVLLSHDSAETRFFHHETAATLARSGFVVAAPTHHADNADTMPHAFTLRQLLHRREQLSATLDVLLTHAEISPSIDPDRVGVVGFGTGGTVALMLGGALPLDEGWRDYCIRAGQDDTYCTPWIEPRMERLVSELPLKRSPADTRIKAVAAVAPAYGMLFRAEGMRWLYPPVLLIKAGADSINRAPLHADAIYAALHRALSVPPFYAVIEGAEASSLMSACPPALFKDIPDLCGQDTLSQRRRALRQLHTLLRQFFIRTLGDVQHMPHIPPPPDLAPPPPVPAVQETPAAPDKKRSRSRPGKGKQAPPEAGAERQP